MQRNIASLSAARECMGDEAQLMLDCWMALDVEYGVQLAESLRPLRPGVDRRDAPRRRTSTAMRSYGTACRGRRSQRVSTGSPRFPFQQAASRRLVDILQPDIAWVGGLTPLLNICAIADAAGLTVIPHGGAGSPYGQHALFALPAIPLGEWYIATAPGVPLENGPLLPGTAMPTERQAATVRRARLRRGDRCRQAAGVSCRDRAPAPRAR